MNEQRQKELEQTALKTLQSLNLSPEERRLVGLMGPFLQVLFINVPEASQTKVLRVFYDYQLAKEKSVSNVDTTQSKEQEVPK